MIHLSINQTLFVIIFLVGALTTIGKQAGTFESFELDAFDQLVRTLPKADESLDVEPGNVIIVEITEADLTTQGEWPFSDLTFAKALGELQEHQPRAIGLDIYRNLPQGGGLAALEEAFAEDNVVAIYDVGADVSAPESIPPERQGFNDLVLDPDNVVRRHLMYTQSGGEEFYSLSLRLALLYLEETEVSLVRSPQFLTIAGSDFPALNTNAGAYQKINAAGYQLLTNQPANLKIERIPFSTVVRGAAPPELIRDRVVLIGSTAPSLKDIFRTPLQRDNRGSLLFSGVEIHAQQVNQIINVVRGETVPFRFWADWQEIIWLFAWGSIGAVIVRTSKNLGTLLCLEILAGCSFLGVTIVLFHSLIWLPVISPAIAFSVCSILALVHRLIDTSFIDGLTKLPNREQFFLHLRLAIQQANKKNGSRFAVLFLGIDRFNIINDTLGYGVGDQILVGLSERIKKSMKPLSVSPLLARVGGDEFALLMPEMDNSKDLQAQADKLQSIVQEPFRIDSKEIVLSCCIGIALGQSGETYEPSQLLRNAHTAMYRAKQLGRSSYEVFAVGMKNQLKERLTMEGDLRHALERNEMELYYQPLVDLRTGYLTGFEALVRWKHPSGLISPFHFIPIAEETGLIIPLGQWITQTACRQIQAWRQRFPEHPHLGLSINLSGRQFSHPNLISDICAILEETNLPPDCLKMEVTESIAMQNVEANIDLLLQLKDLGLKLSIDDFGTGYSSLSYLCQFPIDTLKVDRSFVVRMQESDADYAIVQTIVTLSHALGMTIVAEGIETPEQRDILKDLSCEFGQGYLFAKPLQVADAEALIAKNQPFF